jgi:hypothetical protein
MTRSLALAAMLLPGAALLAQAAPNAADLQTGRPASLQMAVVEPLLLPDSTAALPDAPSPVSSSSAPAEVAFDFGQAPSGVRQGDVAPRFATVILPGQKAAELHGMEKAVYGLHDAFNLTQFAGFTLSAGWSHLIDSQPHYGTNAVAFGKREGAAALRSTVQTLATDAVFSPMFHDDPRYYAMGDSQPFVKRVFYAASRVVVTRSSHGPNNRFNAPLLLGYGAAAGLNNAYYPDQDRGAKNTFQNWGTSLAGAALGFEVSEFLDDALRIVHLRKN